MFSSKRIVGVCGMLPFRGGSVQPTVAAMRSPVVSYHTHHGRNGPQRDYRSMIQVKKGADRYPAVLLWRWNTKRPTMLSLIVQRPHQRDALRAAAESNAQPLAAAASAEKTPEENFLMTPLRLSTYHVASLIAVIEGKLPRMELSDSESMLRFSASNNGRSFALVAQLCGVTYTCVPVEEEEETDGGAGDDANERLRDPDSWYGRRGEVTQQIVHTDDKRGILAKMEDGDLMLLYSHLNSVLSEMFGFERHANEQLVREALSSSRYHRNKEPPVVPGKAGRYLSESVRPGKESYRDTPPSQQQRLGARSQPDEHSNQTVETVEDYFTPSTASAAQSMLEELVAHSLQSPTAPTALAEKSSGGSSTTQAGSEEDVAEEEDDVDEELEYTALRESEQEVDDIANGVEKGELEVETAEEEEEVEVAEDEGEDVEDVQSEDAAASATRAASSTSPNTSRVAEEEEGDDMEQSDDPVVAEQVEEAEEDADADPEITTATKEINEAIAELHLDEKLVDEEGDDDLSAEVATEGKPESDELDDDDSRETVQKQQQQEKGERDDDDEDEDELDNDVGEDEDEHSSGSEGSTPSAPVAAAAAAVTGLTAAAAASTLSKPLPKPSKPVIQSKRTKSTPKATKKRSKNGRKGHHGSAASKRKKASK